MNVEGLHEALLRGLAPGAVMWLPAAGQSLWPLLRDGDSLKVERLGEPLRVGEVAVVKLPTGVLAAHLVHSLEPLQTWSSVGVFDPQPVEALARVIGFRRGGALRELPASSRQLFRWVPRAARILRRVPLARWLVSALRSQ